MTPEEALKDYIRTALLPTFDRVETKVRENGFTERFDSDLKPLPLGYQRLTSQCRQIFSFTQGYKLFGEERYKKKALDGFDFICSKYFAHDGTGWNFAIGSGASLPSSTRHLYAHAFALLACHSMIELGNTTDAIEKAHKTYDVLERHFRVPSRGFYTAIDDKMQPLAVLLEQNPHMHLFESCLLLFEATGEQRFGEFGNEVAELFLSTFFEPTTGTLTEYFNGDWKPDETRGNDIEPGHHFEWVWLILKWLDVCAKRNFATRTSDLQDAAGKLLEWALKYGTDRDKGGIFDVVLRDGKVQTTTKRIWPLLEGLKALRSAEKTKLRAGTEKDFVSFGRILLSHYLLPKTGTWIEHHTRDFTPIITYLPATSPYHLLMAAREL